MNKPLRKLEVVEAIRARVAQDLAAVESVAAMARDEVGNSETRAEGKYDTRSTEASYLARGQAWRVAELRQLLAWFERLELRELHRAEVGALVEIEGHRVEGHRVERLFLAPAGGSQVEVQGCRVRVVSPNSPLGAALAGLEEGDSFEVFTPQGRVEYEVLSLQ